MSNIFAGFESVVQENVPLAALTWYHLGGPARYLVHPQDPEQLQKLARRCVESNVRVLVLGLGANLLVADEGVNAAIFRLDAPHWKQFSSNKGILTAGAGTDMQVLARHCVRGGLSGLECMAGIPGTLGGCVHGNAGGKFGEIGSNISRVSVMSVDGEFFDRTRDDLAFSYRATNIAATFILQTQFELEEDNPEDLVKKFKEIWMFKKNSQPLNTKNAGCTFKNPPGASAGALIDQAGLKGLRIGGAEVSSKHANFISASPGCKTADIIALIEQIEEKVYAKHGINLEREIVIWK